MTTAASFPVERSGAGDRKLAIVPAYNEAEAIGAVVAALRERAPDFDILVIDDGSWDDTASSANAAGADVVRLPFNLGIGGAVQTGFLYALERGYDYAAQVDGDGQHEPAELCRLLDAMRHDASIDMVCGSRFMTSEHRYPAPISRRTGIHIFAFALRIMLRQPVSDPTSGFRLYSRRAIELFAYEYPSDYPEVEAILMLHERRLRMIEVPVRMHARATGRSSINKIRSLYYMVKVSLALLVGLLRKAPTAGPGFSSSATSDGCG